MKRILCLSFAAIIFLAGCDSRNEDSKSRPIKTISAAKSALGSSDLEAGFANPPHSAGIRAFWWWLNGNVTKEAITRDLEEMKDKGFSGALIFDADGSSHQGNRQVPAGPVFGSDEWTELFVHACEEARRLDLELSLSIQSGWNLGGPKVTAEEATQTLTWSKTEVKGPARIEQVLKSPKSKDFYRDVAVLAVPVATESTIRPIKDLELKSATQELGMSAPDCRPLLNTSPALPGEAVVKSKDIINLTAKMDKDGTLRWDVPKGDWQIIRFGHTATGAHVSTCSAGWGGRVLDYLNPDSLGAYWNRNIEPLFKAIGPMAGTTLRYIHTDSWEGGGMNWTPGFDRTFKKNRGYDPLPWLAVMAGFVVDSRQDSNAFLADFRKTIGDKVADHYGQLARLAKQYGMGTHPESAGPHAGPLDGLKNYGRGELMMSEFWSPSPHRPNPPDRFFVKQASSAAHTYGKRLVGAEAFTTIGPHWNDVPWSAMKPSFDHEFCAGLNLVFNHTFTCSPKEMGIPGQEYFAGTHFNPQITWWDEAPAFIDYLRRCQYLAQQGDFVADVVYYYGDHIPNIARRKGDDPAGALGGFDYDVLSEELLLSSMKVENGRLMLPSGMEYRVLVLPDHKILSLEVLKKVDKLVRAGGTVLGPKPLRAVSLEGGGEGKELFGKLAEGLWGQPTGEKGIRKVGKGRIVWGMAARDLLLADGVASDVTFEDKKMASAINWIHYRIDERDVYFLSEPNGKARSVNAIFRVDGWIPELWDAVDGSIRGASTFNFVNGCTEVPLEFDEFGSTFVVFRKKTETGRNDGPNYPTWQTKQLIAGPWDVSFDPKWGGPKTPVRFDTLTDWSKHSDDGIKYYSGKAVYRTTFNVGDDPAGKRLAIELGQVKDIGIATVKLNGVDLGIVWRPPFRVDIGKAVKSGENKLEVMVVNSWRNRLIGDSKLPEDQRLTSTNIKVLDRTVSRRRTKWHLEESGLLGPVTLMTKAELLRLADLRCEYLVDPLGIDVVKPRLSWVLESGQRGQKQSAYRLLVASSREKLNKNIGDLWDTGKVKSDESIHVAYDGKKTKSRMQCFWKVMVWDKDGKPSWWSKQAMWSMGLLSPEAWAAKWITNPSPERLSHPWLRKTFELNDDVQRAVIHVNTPSYYELRINGKKVSPYVLTPGISKIDKRFLINTHDVTSYLVKGTNCIALWMGPGWHQPRIGNKHNSPILRVQLDIQTPSGLIVIGTDSSWRIKESCISQIGGWKWNDFGGEHYDGRKFVSGWDQADLDDSSWLSALEIAEPNVVHSWQGCESARLSQPVLPKKIFQLENGKWVIDFGRPLTGWMRLRMHGLKEGQEVKIIYADLNDNDNVRKLAFRVNSDGFQSFNQEDVFISAGNGTETFCSKFNYHSFRYAVISGLSQKPAIKDAAAMMIEPELESAGSFECSNDLFNQIHEITRYTLRTQNPGLALGTGEAREKSAYGDGGAHLSGYLYNYKCAANLRKWIRDWSDGQRQDGWFGHTAPAFEDHGGGPAWGGQVTELVRRMQLYYGDLGIVEQMYDRLSNYVDFIESKTQDGILRSYTPTKRGEGMMFIGDWVRPDNVPGKGFNMDSKAEREFFNNCSRAMLWQQLQDYAKTLGRDVEYKRCSEHLAKIRPLIHKTFYLEDKGTYTFNNQGCLAMALYAHIPPAELRPKILAQLEHDIVVNKKGHLDTGLLGTFIMLDLLIKEDRNDLIELIMGQATYPGWGFLVKEMGLNTWPETWSGWGSHVILVTATPGSWFFEGLGGILPDPKHPGLKHFTLRPGLVKSVNWVKCSYESPYGKIASNWEKNDGTFKWEVTVPPNTTATVYISGKNITEGGLPAAESEGVTLLRMEKNKTVFKVESGTYEFKSVVK